MTIERILRIQSPDFNLEATLESGQVFGFTKTDEGAFRGVLAGKSVTLRQQDSVVVVHSDGKGPTEEVVRFYFDLDRDMTAVYDVLRRDSGLITAYERFKGLRLIRQDSWEALAGFIISANNHVKRIKGIWRRLSEHFSGACEKFPGALVVAKSNEHVLRTLGLGYRAPYLFESARMVAARPDRFTEVRKGDYEQAKKVLLEFPGVGEKVADCVLLYGFQKYEAFPVDTWVLRAIRRLYFKNRRVPRKEVRQFGQKRWGALAGYVQQYLFHAVRMGLLF